MDSRISEATTALISGRNGLRGMPIVGADLECLKDGARLKVPGTLLNVALSLLQLLGERDSGGDERAIQTTLLRMRQSARLEDGV